jgi:predicted PurR-regulated permease PerM
MASRTRKADASTPQSQTPREPRIAVPGGLALASARALAGDPEQIAPVRPARERSVRVRSYAITGLLVLALLYTFYFAKNLLLPIALALLLNLLLAPIVRNMRRYLRIPQALGAAAVLAVLVGSVAGGFYFLSGPTARWWQEMPLAIWQIEYKLQTLKAPVEEVRKAAARVEELASAQGDEPGDEEPVEVVVQGPSLTEWLLGGAAAIVAGLVVMVALLFFLLASGDTLLRQAVTLLPRLRDKKRMVEMMREMEDDVSFYLLTISLINAGLGIAIGTAMYLLGMPNAVLWGVMAALFNFVPYLGALVGAGVVGLVALLSFEQPLAMLLPPLVYLTLTSIEGYLVTPAMLARRLTLNPIAVFLSLILWTWVWGIGGALLAVPLLATFKICCDHIEPLKPIGTMLEG